MDSSIKASHAPSDSMDLLSRAWCDTAIQVLQPAVHDTSTTVLEDNLIKIFENDMKAPLPTMNVVDGDLKPLPRWKSDDLKSWIWLQKTIHPELNYDRCFRKKWSLPSPWKLIPFKEISIKKWIVEMKRKRKDEERLQRAEMHAAISVAGVAAALAAVAAENVKANKSNSTKEAAVASAAALVASQCVQAAEDMGANRKELSKVVSSAMAATNACDILTLTAAAATSLRGAATLRARPGRKEKDGCGPILPLEETRDFDFDFGKYRTLLATGAELTVRSSDGKSRLRLVSVILNGEAKVILKIRNINALKGFASTKESIVTDIREDQTVDAEAAGSIVLTTSRGTSIKLEINDYTQYKIWFVTINHMLMLSTTFSGYELHFYRN
ncbi:VAN3-binding protein [Magnolia sinica]|uniref:VAN3-binding protein n=1 Tax=Magnolia sinica TaxID=86752 RepID=UPI00265949C5|nr:VAN3-binding protein [Magnolia sinica]